VAAAAVHVRDVRDLIRQARYEVCQAGD
jgi:hypothetical protein